MPSLLIPFLNPYVSFAPSSASSRKSSFYADSHSQIFLGLFVIGPWLFLVVYDIALYIFRTVHFHTPVIGGRAQGQQRRPRAPSLRARPDGEAREFFPLGRVSSHSRSQSLQDEDGGPRSEASGREEVEDSKAVKARKEMELRQRVAERGMAG